MKNEIIAALRGVYKSYNNIKALNGINLSVYKGEVVGLVGPNGAGKTTTLRIISGILQPDKGDVYVLGRKMTSNHMEIKKLVGYLPEVPRLYENLKVIEHVNVCAKGWGLSLPESILKEWGLSELASRPIKTLSKGQKQKVNFVCAYLHNPELILLDEPFSGLDVETKEFLREKVRLLSDQGKTLLISSHDIDEVERLSTVISIIADGKIILQGNTGEIKDRLLGHLYRLHLSKIPDDLENIGKLVEKYEVEKDSLSIRFQVQDAKKINEILNFFIERDCIIYAFQPLRLEEHLLSLLKTKQ